jgi:hypothetical protein
MPAPTKNRIVRASALVMATGVNVLFVVLLVSSRERVTPEPIAAAMIWMVVEQSRAPQQRPARERERGRSAPTARVERATASEASVRDTSIQVMPAPQPTAGIPPTQPSIDWAMQSQLAAERSVANYGKANAFSPAPGTDLPARLCAPRDASAIRDQMEDLRPQPPEPYAGAEWPPAGSVRLAGNVIVQFIQFSVPVGRGSAREAAPIRREGATTSSVPDANKCD